MPISSISQGLGFGGGATATSSGAPGGTPFTNLLSASFDGGGDHITVPEDASINISGDISFSAWVKQSAQSAYGTIFAKRIVGVRINYQFVMKNSTGAIGLGHSGGWVYDGMSLPSGSWYHVAATLDSGTVQFYVNGVAKDQGTGVTITGTTDDLIIGAVPGSNAFNGLIDEAAIFDSALSSSDITAIYNSGTPNDISGLNPVGWWRMGDGGGDVDGAGGAPANDGAIGTIVNAATGTNSGGSAINGSQTSTASQPKFSTVVP